MTIKVPTQKNVADKITSLFIDNMHVDGANTHVIEGYTLQKNGDVKDALTGQPLPNGKDLGGQLLDAAKWIQFAADAYQISPDIRDYAFVPVEIIRSELPNKNGIGFTFEELARFNPEHGMLAYQTWKGKGCYAEHENNRIPEVAKGVIIDVALRKAPEFEGNFYRLNHFLAYDRNKDQALAQQIIKKERVGYSMGSMCQFYSCSICKENVNDMGGVCNHIDVRSARARALSMRPIEIGGRRYLAYARPHYITGIECSSVVTPAAQFAKSSQVFE
jgi:hypothetical protein